MFENYTTFIDFKTAKRKKILYYFLFALYIITFTIIIAANYIEPDTLWHIKAGEYMVKNKTILTKDVFSWSMPNANWHSHEWLWEIIAYLIYSKFNFIGLAVFNAIIMAIFLIKTNEMAKINYIGELLYFIFSVNLIITGAYTARPYTMAYMLFVLILIKIIKKDTYTLKDYIIISLLTILYANIHSSVIILTIVLLMLTIYNRRYLSLLITIFLSSLITPFNIKTYIYAAKLSSDANLIGYINEWQVPDFHKTYVLAIMMIILILYIMLNYKIAFTKKVKDIILINIFILMGIAMYLKSVRHFYSLFIFFIIANYIALKHHEDYINDINIVSKIGILVVSIIAIFYIYKAPVNIIDPIKTKQYYHPTKAIELIKKKNLKNICNDYLFGGALIFNDIKVFVDGRGDMYYFNSKQFWDEYTDIMFLEKPQNELKKIIKKYNIEYFMIMKNKPVNIFLENNYNCIYEDDYVKIYKIGSRDKS